MLVHGDGMVTDDAQRIVELVSAILDGKGVEGFSFRYEPWDGKPLYEPEGEE